MKTPLALFIASLVFVATPVFAQTNADIQALLLQIQTLQAKIKDIQAAQGTGTQSGSAATAPPTTATGGIADDYGTGTTGSYCPKLSSTLERNARDASSSNQVSELQKFLSYHYDIDPSEIVTGFFGRVTQDYVIRYQKEQGLPAFGIAGSLTRAAVLKSCGSSAGGTPGTTPTQTSDFKAVQMKVTTDSLTATAWVTPGPWTGHTYEVDFGEGDSSAQTLRSRVLTICNSEWMCSAPGGQMHTYVYPGTYRINLYALKLSSTGQTLRVLVTGQTVTVTAVPDPVTPPPTEGSTISVTSPNGGEQWEVGSLNTITWTPYSYSPTTINGATQVLAYLERADGTRVGRILDTGKASLHTYFNIDTYEKWATPGQYYVRVVNTVTGASDRSDGLFTILPRAVDLKLNGSDGPISADPNSLNKLTWTTTGVDRCELHNVYPDVSRTQQVGAVSLSGSKDVYLHTSAGPTLYCYTSDGKAKYDSVRVNVQPGSSSATLKVSSPNGGEKLLINSPHTITWAQTGVASLSLALYKNDQWMKWITQNLPLTGGSASYAWTPSGVEAEAAPLGSVFKIYAMGQRTDGSGTLEDKSDMPFSFATVSTPATPTVSFSASPSTVTSGQNAYLWWSVSNAKRCVLKYGSSETSISLSGSKVVYPLETTVYTIWCANDTGDGKDGPSNSKNVTITVTQPTPPPTATTTSTGSMVLFVAGVYQATGSSHSFCHSDWGSVSVAVPASTKPVILALSSYEPVNWNVSVPAGTTISKVILGGYNPQSVTGVSAPVEKHFYLDYDRYTQGSASYAPGQGAFYDDRSTPGNLYHWAGHESCINKSALIPTTNRRYFNGNSDYFYAYSQGSAEYNSMLAKLQSYTGLTPTVFAGTYSTNSLTIPAPTAFKNAEGMSLASAYSALIAMEAQLRELLKRLTGQ